MRTLLLPNLLEALARNDARTIPGAKAFEIGNTFLNIIGEEGLPREEYSLAMGCYGEGESFFTLKGAFAELMAKLGVRDLGFETEENSRAYHPGRCARILSGETHLGYMGEVHPDVREEFGLSCRVYCLEVSFDRIASLSDRRVSYTPLPLSLIHI